MKKIGLWILNPWKTSGGQPVALGGFGVWRGGYFFGSIDHFCFCWLSRFLRKICSMIPLIVFVSVDFRILNGRFVAWLHWSCLFSVIFAFFTRDLYQDSIDHFCFRWILHFQRETCRRCGKTAMIPLIIFLRWIWQPWTVPSQNCMWKICQKPHCRWRGAIPILPAAARPHPKTADEACNLDWGPLECQCVASSGTVFGALWLCPALEHFYSRNLSSKTSLSPARLQHINVFKPGKAAAYQCEHAPNFCHWGRVSTVGLAQ